MAERSNAAETPTSANEAISEPENSTVDDWLGQRVARDSELADDLVEQAGGDQEQAERRFQQVSDEAEDYHRQHEQR